MLLLALVLVLPPAAHGAEPLDLTALDGKQLRGPFAGWARAVHVPLPHGRIRVGLRGCPGYPDLAGCVKTRQPRVIHLRPDAQHKRSVFLHELGHVFDLTVMAQDDRRAFRRVHGRAARGWWNGVNATGEWFAEAYSLCARYGSRRPAGAATTYGYRPSPRSHRRTCRVIRRAGAAPRPPRPPAVPNPPPTLTEPPQVPAPVAPPPPPPPEQQCVLLILCTS